jgi:hypothetical protein
MQPTERSRHASEWHRIRTRRGMKAHTYLASRPLALALALSACGAPGWEAGRGVLADSRAVAAALGDPAPDVEVALADLPAIEPPHHMRPCCAFGMDLEVDFAGMHVPLFQVGNVIAVDQLGSHAYALTDGAMEVEGNGLLYSCRGGWIDTAHVRENADNVLFLALRIAAGLGSETTIVIPGHGATTTIVVAPIPAAVIEREGALAVAGVLAAWTAYRISIWHEVATWYGYEMIGGFSEKPSAFSPEDLYSNALGIRLALAILAEHRFRTDEEYGLAFSTFLEEALRRIEVQPVETSRAVMDALDGRWWDSSRRLPDNMLVTRRAFPRDDERVVPWRAEDAFVENAAPAALESACRGARTRSLSVPTGIGHLHARDVVSIVWTPEGWAEATLPSADADHGIVEEQELDGLVVAVHAALEAELGAGFDQPSPRATP